MNLNAWSCTDKGLRRNNNQDSFLLRPDIGLFVVADGMGGHSGGEVASAMAVKVAEEVTEQGRKAGRSARELLPEVYAEASRRIYDKATHESPDLAGMGTTMVVLYQFENSIYIGNVGDSRAYLFRRPWVWQLTEDHSMINEQVRDGTLTEEQAKKAPGKNVVTRSVGYERNVMVDIIERPLHRGDSFLICSDGLTGMVSDEQIADILSFNAVTDIPQMCVKKALEHGGVDNVTVVFVQVD